MTRKQRLAPLPIFLAAGLFAAPLCTAEPDDASGLDALVEVLAEVDDAAFQRDVLTGMHDALRGRKGVQMPGQWKAAYAKLAKSRDAQVREQATILALIFGDTAAVESLRNVLMDGSAKTQARHRTLAALVEAGTPKLAPLLHRLLDDTALRHAALQALAAYDHEATPRIVLKRYASLPGLEKPDAIATLASRAEYAFALLDAIERGTVPRSDLTAFTVRQLQAFGDKRINGKLAKVWGAVRPTSQQKAALMAKYKSLLTPDSLASADLANGRRLYQKTCASCHRLYGVGGEVGPDLTGSNRKNLDYVLENVLDPSAMISRDYKLTLVVTEGGRLLSGIVARQTDETVTIQTANQRVVLAREDVARMQASDVSMMPEGALDKMTREEVRDLVAYLKTEGQVPLPEEKTD